MNWRVWLAVMKPSSWIEIVQIVLFGLIALCLVARVCLKISDMRQRRRERDGWLRWSREQGQK